MNEYETTIIRKKISCYGQVQGVGFRFRAKKAAETVGATGWVRNEDDGSVSMEIQGTEQQIDQLFLLITKGTYIRIDRMTAKTIPLVENEASFDIRELTDFWNFWHSRRKR